MGWLLVLGLGIIWVALLFPFRHWKPSPASSVEEFERKMNVLAETNGTASGRWVLMPRKGERFMGTQERERARVRRRRRKVLVFLVEATALTLLIGMFPPLRRMLVGSAVLGFFLLAYIVLLIKLRADEVARARRRRARARAQGHRRAYEPRAVPTVRMVPAARTAPAARLASSHAGRSAPVGEPYDAARSSSRSFVGGGTNGNGHGLGNGKRHAYARGAEDDDLFESGVRILEDNVHVTIRRADELDREVLEALAR